MPYNLSEQEVKSEISTAVWMKRIMRTVGSLAAVGTLWLGAHAVVEGFDGQSDKAVPDAAMALAVGGAGVAAFAASYGAEQFRSELTQEQTMDNRGDL